MMHEKILNSISLHLTHGGYVFVGHAETLHGLNVPYAQVFPTVYKKIMSHN
jgi:chemotaxis protein methyltransferase CheR